MRKANGHSDRVWFGAGLAAPPPPPSFVGPSRGRGGGQPGSSLQGRPRGPPLRGAQKDPGHTSEAATKRLRRPDAGYGSL